MEVTEPAVLNPRSARHKGRRKSEDPTENPEKSTSSGETTASGSSDKKTVGSSSIANELTTTIGVSVKRNAAFTVSSFSFRVNKNNKVASENQLTPNRNDGLVVDLSGLNVPGKVRNTWLHSELARQTVLRVKDGGTQSDISSRISKASRTENLDRIRRNLVTEFESGNENQSEVEPIDNVTVQRKFSFDIDEKHKNKKIAAIR